MAGVWAVLGVMLCLSTHARGQLGEGMGVDGGAQGEEGKLEVETDQQDYNPDDTHTQVSDDDDDDDDANDGDGDGDDDDDDSDGDGGGDDAGVGGDDDDEVKVVEEVETRLVDTSLRWKTVEETYQGCFLFNRTTGGLMYVNLTQVMELEEGVDSLQEACYHMCLVMEPFAYYLSLSPATRPNETDACGCHQEEHLDPGRKLQNDTSCDTHSILHRVYCGPANYDCYNRGSSLINSSPYSSLLALLLFLLPVHYSNPYSR